jgi:hypothetical protein
MLNAVNVKRYTVQVSPSQSPNATPKKATPRKSPVSTPLKTPQPQTSSPKKTPASTPRKSPRSTPFQTPQPKTSPAAGSPSPTSTPSATSTPAQSSPMEDTPWLVDLNLKESDRAILLRSMWLNDRIIDAVNTLASSAIGGDCQTTLLGEGACGFSAVAGEMMMVIHDSEHWVACASIANEVLLADSAHRPVSVGVRKQLKELFKGMTQEDGKLEVRIVPCATQQNAFDCGVYAAAFIFEWCNGLSNLNVDYDTDDMRGHLIRCLERGEAEPFAKVKSSRRGRPRRGRVVKI